MSRKPSPAASLEAPPHDPDAGPRRLIGLMVGLILAFLVTAVAWASFAELDVAVQVRGTVVPPSRLQEVGTLEGGIVQEVLVQPGERVRAGQVLARLDTAQAEADVGESRQQQLAALAGLARVDALLQGGEPHFDALVQREAPSLVDKETQLWRDAQREYLSAQTGLREAASARRAELVEAEARIRALSAAVKVAEEAHAIEDRLFREGAGSRADFLAAQQRLLQQRTELDAVQQSLPRLRAGASEAQAQLAQSDARARAEWGRLRTEFQARTATLDAQLGGRRDRAARRELLAPIDGVVNRVLLTTRGALAVPGKPVVEIVPDEAELVLSVRVKPQDIGFIHVGQQAQVRVLPYDASTYGKMGATVQRVGADALPDEKEGPYFEVQLAAARDQLKLHGKALPINAGMPVEAGILTGQRSVMQYLLKPVLRGVQGALQER
ncbi:MAG: hypothetical protein RLY78_3042 [Pseudomonadota bacterium]